MKIGVITNEKRVKDKQCVEELFKLLKAENFDVVEIPETESADEILPALDVVLVLGGDGAILHAALRVAKTGAKVVGINYGTLGFLAEFERDEAAQAVELIKNLKKGECTVLHRTILEIAVKGKTYYALNEVSFQRDHANIQPREPQMLSVQVQVGKENATFTGDGVLLSTPTGSTAYSLSAGGAILSPQVPVFMLTPICAFSFNSRPIVFPDTDVFEVKITRGNGIVSADGKVLERIDEQDEIIVKKAPFSVDFPMNNDSCLLTKIKNKLK